MQWLNWIVASALFALFGFFAAANLWIAYTRSGSMLPFVGGLMGAVGFRYLPVECPWYYALVPLFVDIGCLPLLIAYLVDRLLHRFHHLN